MTTALAVIAPTAIVPLNPNDLARSHYGRELDQAQWELFYMTANTLGLSIASKQIYAILRDDKKNNRKVMTIQIGIDGARSIAAQSGKLGGVGEPQWCGEDGIWKSIWFDKKPPAAAKVVVYRQGADHGFVGVAMYGEFCQRGADGNPSNLWHTMPAVMLRKCAESQALRMAFPHELSGVYTEEEMQQADNTTTAEARNQLATALDAIDHAFDVGELLGPVKALCEALKGSERVEAREVFTAKLKELQAAVQRDMVESK